MKSQGTLHPYGTANEVGPGAVRLVIRRVCAAHLVVALSQVIVVAAEFTPIELFFGGFEPIDFLMASSAISAAIFVFLLAARV